MKFFTKSILAVCLLVLAFPVLALDESALWQITVDSTHPPKVYFIYTDMAGQKMCQWVDLSKPVKPLRTNGVFFMLNHYQGTNTAEDWKVCYPQ